MEPPTYQMAHYIVPLVTGITALILLLAGGRLLKPAIGLCGGLIGAGIGLIVAPELTISVSPFIVALLFGVLGALIAMFIAKFAILLTLGLGCAIMVPVITWHFAGLGDGAQVIEEVIAAATTLDLEEVQETESNPDITTQDAVSEAFLILTTDASKITHEGIQRANAAWNVIPTGSRVMLIGSALAGLLLGLLITTFLPYLASALVTSVVGSILLVEAVRNGMALAFSQHSMSDVSPTVLVITTACIAFAGLGVQMTLSKKRNPHKQVIE